MTANRDALRALFASLIHDEEQPTEDLGALAERCSRAPIAELGQILFDAKSAESQKVVAAEIQRRLSQ